METYNCPCPHCGKLFDAVMFRDEGDPFPIYGVMKYVDKSCPCVITMGQEHELARLYMEHGNDS